MIRFNSIHLKYNQKTVFNDFSLHIDHASKVVILGGSGIGKSSLFSLILGFVQPDQGKVFINNVPVDEQTVWAVRRQIAFVDQDVSLGNLKVSEWLNFISSLKANSILEFSHDKVRQLFDYFELSHELLEKEVMNLSGGERQRIAIILSVLLDRKIFLLDEVTAALDQHLKRKVTDFYTKDNDWTVVVISHDDTWLNNDTVKIFDLGKKEWIR
jgi:putative ABC transport system ATP-binding protein